jgi:hypothetical protein
LVLLIFSELKKALVLENFQRTDISHDRTKGLSMFFDPVL